MSLRKVDRGATGSPQPVIRSLTCLYYIDVTREDATKNGLNLNGQEGHSPEEGQVRPSSRGEGCNNKRLDVMPPKRHGSDMQTSLKRATVYFDASLHRALRVKAAVTEKSLSEIVNAAVKQSMAEDAEDLAAFKDRALEPNLAFEAVLKDLKQRGKL